MPNAIEIEFEPDNRKICPLINRPCIEDMCLAWVEVAKIGGMKCTLIKDVNKLKKF